MLLKYAFVRPDVWWATRGKSQESMHMSGIPRGIVSSFCRNYEAFLIPVN